MISVIVPAYNAEKWLGECLESIISQKGCGEIETIVVNDGSTDSTPQIAASYPGVRLFNTSNHGQASARNHGIRKAHGEWITFVDADDALMPGGLAFMLKAALRSDADIVTAGFTENRFKVSLTGKSVTLDGREALINTLYQHPHWHNSAWAKLIRTDLMRQTMFTDGLYYEDLDVTARLYLLPGVKVCSLHDTIYWYRPNPESFLHKFTPSRLDVLTVTEKIEKMSSSNPSLLAAARSRRLSACFNMYLLTHRRPGYEEANDLCRNEIRRLRGKLLSNPRMRLKNKIAVIASYLLNPLL
ncbi:MAG: glycosyltransferase [Muribaculaceae bacterium]|nr:glycosyltransferase [Muribaculaceae bacterium]